MMRDVLLAAACALLLTTGAAQAQIVGGCPGGQLESLPSETAVRMTFRNATDQMVTAFWVDFDGVRQRYADIAAGGSWQARTYDGHVWAFVTEHGLCIDQHEVVSGERRYTIR
jgi:hypothetical protein